MGSSGIQSFGTRPVLYLPPGCRADGTEPAHVLPPHFPAQLQSSGSLGSISQSRAKQSSWAPYSTPVALQRRPVSHTGPVSSCFPLPAPKSKEADLSSSSQSWIWLPPPCYQERDPEPSLFPVS